MVCPCLGKGAATTDVPAQVNKQAEMQRHLLEQEERRKANDARRKEHEEQKRKHEERRKEHERERRTEQRQIVQRKKIERTVRKVKK